MKKFLGIIAGEPNSISSEIIFKSWKLRKKYKHRPFFVVGSVKLLNLQIKKLKYNIKIKKIDKNFKSTDLIKSELPVYDVSYDQKKAFEKISLKSNNYIFKCFNIIFELIKQNKLIGFINCPVSKESLFKNYHQGITEFLLRKIKAKDSGCMLIFNKKLSVSPITTHIALNKVFKTVNEKKIIQKIQTINKFYIKFLNKKPKFAILGLNPHNFTNSKKSKEYLIIHNSIKKLSKLNINVSGPIAADSTSLQCAVFSERRRAPALHSVLARGPTARGSRHAHGHTAQPAQRRHEGDRCLARGP